MGVLGLIFTARSVDGIVHEFEELLLDIRHGCHPEIRILRDIGLEPA